MPKIPLRVETNELIRMYLTDVAQNILYTYFCPIS